MSCDLTPTLVAEYLAGDLSAHRHQAYAKHLAGCEHCQSELADLSVTHAKLANWHNQSVPEWSRTSVATSAQVADVSFTRVSAAARQMDGSTKAKEEPRRPGWRPDVRQWLPLAASLLLAIAALTQARISIDPTGWTLSFGTSTNGSSMIDDRVILERQRGVDMVSGALRQRLNTHQYAGSVRGRYLAGQGIVLEISEPGLLPPDAPLTRPGPDAVREVLALSLAPGETGRMANERSSEQMADVELQMFSALCESGGDLWVLPQDEYVTLVLPTIGQSAGHGAVRERIYRLSGRDVLACQQGSTDGVAALRQRAVSYSY